MPKRALFRIGPIFSRQTSPNYDFLRATVEARSANGAVLILNPEKRFYPEREAETTEAAVHVTPLGNLYIALGDQAPDGRWTLRAWSHPLAVWIWLGGAIMAAGGLLSLADVWVRQPLALKATARRRAAEALG